MNPKTLRNALVAIAQADVGAGGLVTLCGVAEPLIYWRTLADAELPRVAYFLVDAEEGTESGKWHFVVQFTIWAGPQNGQTYMDLADDIRERVETVMTQGNLLARGVDAAPLRLRKRDLPPENEGVIGLVLEMELFNAA